MSLIIGKLDKNLGKATIYSDGICVAGVDIVSNYCRKVYGFVHDDLKILFGGTGSHYINRYFGENLQFVFEKEFIGLSMPYKERGYYFQKLFTKVFNELLIGFKEYYNIDENNEELSHDGSLLVIVNDTFYKVQKWDIQQ